MLAASRIGRTVAAAGILFSLGSSAPTAAEDVGHVAIIRLPAASYAPDDWNARAAAAREFYGSHGDGYDFLVVFPAVPVDVGAAAGAETLGRHFAVRNAVAGIGVAPIDAGGQFGSQSRLKGFIDVYSLVPGLAQSGFDAAVATTAHEIAHQWSGRVGFRDLATGSRSSAILGADGTHWSFYLDSDASVLYGSDWRAAGGGTFVADASMRRYSALDLYLMGFLDPSEVPNFALLVPAGVPPHPADAPPPPDGTSVTATARTVSVADVVAAEGPRSPSAATSQRIFRAAFAIAVAPGQEPNAEQVAFVDAVRREWANRFFFMTRGQALMATELLEWPARDVAEHPSVSVGLDWLLASQGADGAWRDSTDSVTRETQTSLEALALFGSDPRSAGALSRGAAFLAATEPEDTDSWSRRALGLVAARNPGNVPPVPALPASDGGFGLSPGYRSTVIDTTLAGLAFQSQGWSSDAEAVSDFLLDAQNGDGGWPFVAGGPSAIEPTARVLQLLARLPQTARTGYAVQAANAYLLANRLPDGSYGAEVGAPDETALVLLALDAWGYDWGGSGASVDALLSMQLVDGSWNGSVHATALALHALRSRLAPNLTAFEQEVWAPARITEGQPAEVVAIVRNVGRAAAGAFAVGLFDAEGRALAAPQSVVGLGAGATASVTFAVESTGHAGNQVAYVVVDPDGRVDETSELDNRATVPFAIDPAPPGPDPFVAGPLVVTPSAIRSVPAVLSVSGRVGNLGLTSATAVEVALVVANGVAATTTIDLPPGSLQPVSLTATVAVSTGAVPVALVVHPRATVPDARSDNNAVSTIVPVEPVVDLAVASVQVIPPVVEQGREVEVAYSLVNHGTAAAEAAQVSASIRDGSGAVIATLPATTVSLASGAVFSGAFRWKASLAGKLLASVEASHPAEARPEDDRASAALEVTPSTLPNLRWVGSPSVTPDPPLVGANAEVAATLRNDGAGAAGPFVAELRAGPTGTAGTVLARVEAAGLAPGGTLLVSGPLVPASDAPIVLAAAADVDAQVDEFDEEDNQSVRSVSALPLADLVLVTGDIQPANPFPAPGEVVPVGVSVYNAGGQESAPVRVDVHLGDPDAGGVVIGSADLAGIPARERRVATFSWDTSGLEGTQVLFASVNVPPLASEQRYDNNRASRTFVVQSGAVAVSHPFFSPNADGVKDTTQITWRLGEPTAVGIRIEDADGRLVNIATIPADTNTYTWDGRLDSGELARDGDYEVTLTASSGAETVQLGRVGVVLDTNRLLIHDPRYAALVHETDLAESFSAMSILPDERTALLGLRWNGSHRPDYDGFYGQNVLGGPLDPYPIDWTQPGDDVLKDYTVYFNLGFLDGDAERLAERYSVSASGTSIALAGRSPAHWCSGGRYEGEWCWGVGAFVHPGHPRVVLIDLARGTYDALATAEDGHVPTLVQFTPDGERIYFGSTPSDYGDYSGTPPSVRQIFSVSRAGDRILEVELPSPAWWFRISPDGRRIATVSGEGLSIVELDGVRLPCVVNGTTQASRVEWLSDARRVVLFDYAFGDVTIVDVDSGEVMEQPLPPGFVSVAIGAAFDALFFRTWGDGALYVADPPGSTPSAFAAQGETYPAAIYVSPSATSVVVESSEGASALANLANLTAVVDAVRPAGATAFTFHGFATDAHLESWDIAVRRYPSTAEPVVVARGTAPVVDGELGTWMPPGPGTYEAILTVRDRAGNADTASTYVAWSNAPAIANLFVDPSIFSPNGDGRLDTALVRYTAALPVNARFEIVAASGEVIRTIERTHVEPGDYAFTWNGLDDTGVRAPDGDYVVRAEGVSQAVTIDTTPPAVDTLIADKFWDPYDGTAQFRHWPEERGGTETLSGGLALYKGVLTGFVWRAQDAAFDRASVEIAPAGSSAFDAIQTVLRVPEGRFRAWADDLAGLSFRVRAVDRAGNETVTDPRSFPEGLHVIGVGDGLSFDASSGWIEEASRTVPRFDLLEPVLHWGFLKGNDDDSEIREEVERPFVVFSQRPWAVSLSAAVDVPIVAYSMEYLVPGVGMIRDYQNVHLAGPGAVTWNASAVSPRAEKVEIVATDLMGRDFRAEVPFTYVRPATLAVCVTSVPGETAHVSVRFEGADPSVDGLAPGAALSFWRPGTASPSLVAPVGGVGSKVGENQLEYRADVGSGALSDCGYALEVQGMSLDGRAVYGRADVDLCGINEVAGTRVDGEAVLRVQETYRKAIRAVELFAPPPPGSTRRTYLGSWPGFDREAELAFPWASCPLPQVEYEVTFEDGTREGTTASCATPHRDTCASLQLAARPGPQAPVCSPNDMRYALSATGSTNGLPGFATFESEIVAASGLFAIPVTMTGFVPGPGFTATGALATTEVPDGLYFLRVKATRPAPSSGSIEVISATSKDPIYADRTPPVFGIGSPADGARLCPEKVTGAYGDGALAFPIDYSVADDMLRSFAIRFRRVGDGQYRSVSVVEAIPPDPPRVERRSGRAWIAAAELPPGTYEMQAVASDASLGSVCEAPRVVHVEDAAVLASASATPLFSPDADGTLDVAELSFVAEGAGLLTATAVDVGGARAEVFGVALSTGTSTAVWDGTTTSGQRLPDGWYTVELALVDGCSNVSRRSVEVTIDTIPPVARIDSPAPGASVTATVIVQGEATDAGLSAWELGLGAGADPTAFTTVESSVTPARGLLASIAAGALAPGQHTLRLVARDGAGHVSEARRTFSVTPATLLVGLGVAPALISPSGDGTLDAASGTAELASPGVLGLSLLGADGAALRSLRAPADAAAGTYPFAVDAAALAGLPDGAYGVQATVTAGDTTETALVPFEVDRAAPELSISVPVSGANVRGATPVSGSIADTHPGTWRLVLRGGGSERVVATGDGERAGPLAQLSGLPDGDHEIVLGATDAAGNSRELTVAFRSDATPPEVRFVAPAENSHLSGMSGPVLVTAAVLEANVRAIELSATTGTRHTLASSNTASSAFQVPWDVAAEPDGGGSLVLAVEDEAGNVSEATLPVTIDNTAPVAHIDTPRDGYLAVDSVLGTVADANLDHYVVELASGPPGAEVGATIVGRGAAPVAGGAIARFATPPPDGLYTLRLTVVDRAGNRAEDVTTVLVDNTPPAVPTDLVAVQQGEADVALSFAPSASSDVAGYVVYRGAARVTAQPIVGTSFIDVAVPDGTWTYTVAAVDQAGLEGAASEPASVVVDARGPLVAIARPTDGSTVGGVVEVLGTAYAERDFARFRVEVGPGAQPTSFVEVGSGITPIRHGTLARVDTTVFADGPHAIRLRAEDVAGHVSEARATVTVDNTAPAAPVLLSATVSASTVTVVWRANVEADMAGYLLFRDGVPVNAPAGGSWEDPAAYLLPKTQTSYANTAVPDGRHVYDLVALDAAGNPSARSNGASVVVETRAPIAFVESPATLARIPGRVNVVARTVDEDVARVQIEARSRSDEPFVAIAPPRTAYPYAAELDPASFGGPAIEVRAVATDTGGRTDPAPVSAFLFLDPPLLAPSVVPVVDGYQVSVGWTDPNAAAGVAGYGAWSGTQSLVPAAAPVTGSASASSSNGTFTPGSAYDGNWSSRWVSAGGAPQHWQLDLSAPRLVRQISSSAYYSGTANVLVKVRGLWVTLARGVPASTTVPIAPPLEIQGVRFEFTATPSGRAGLTEVTVDATPLLTAPPVSQTVSYTGDHVYRIEATSRFGTSAAGEGIAHVYAPTLTAASTSVQVPTVRVQGKSRPGDLVHVTRAGVEVTTAIADDAGQYVADVPLLSGLNPIRARATANGNVSLWSGILSVRYTPMPQVDVSLSLASLDGATASFTFTAEGETAAVTSYAVLRLYGTTPSVYAYLAPAERAITATLANGTYRYAVRPEFSSGSGRMSNVVEFTVSLAAPPPPSDIAVAPSASGDALVVSWTAPPVAVAGYLVVRGDQVGGPFMNVSGYGALAATEWADTAVEPGRRYYYRVYARDPYGNLSAPSAIAAGVIPEGQPPAPPRITAPTTPGNTLAVTTSETIIAGISEPYSDVDVFRNGGIVGRARAGASEILFTPFETTYGVEGGSDITPDGRFIAYETWLGGDDAIVIEDRLEGTTRAVSAADTYLVGRPLLSPDGARVAIVGYSYSDWVKRVFVGDGASGVLSPLVPDSATEHDAPAWSPDSSRIAYRTYPSWIPSVAVAEVGTGTEHVLWTDAVERASEPAWMGNGAVATVLEPPSWDALPALARLDAWTGARTDVYQAQSLTPPIIPAPDPARVAVRASGPEGWTLYIVDIAAGAPVASFGAVSGSSSYSAAFAPDESQIAFFNGSSTLVVGEVAGGATRNLGYAGSSVTLAWPAGLGPVALRDGQPPASVDGGGRFQLGPIALAQGSNAFVAVAEDGSGNRSEPSQPIEVYFDAAPQPDLAIAVEVEPSAAFADAGATAVVTVRNVGGATSTSTHATLRMLGSDGSVRSVPAMAVAPLAPGESAVGYASLDLAGLAGRQEIVAEVDAERRVADADRSNNRLSLEFLVVSGTDLALDVVAAPDAVGVDGSVAATATLVNAGPTRNATVRLSLRDTSGETVVSGDPVGTYPSLATGASVTLERTFPVGVILAGDYAVVAEADASDSSATAVAPIRVLPERLVGLTLSSDRVEYGARDDLFFTGAVTNASRNAFLDGATYRLDVGTPGGPVVYAGQVVPLPVLWIGGSLPLQTWIPPGILPAGAYEARVRVELDGEELASATTAIAVVGEPLLAGTIVIAAPGNPPIVRSGEAVEATLAIQNVGTAPSSEALAHLAVVDGRGASLARATFDPGALVPGGQWSISTPLATAGLPVGTYGLVLSVEKAGAYDILASATFRIADGLPPDLSFAALADGTWVRGSVRAAVRAVDDSSGTAAVTVLRGGDSVPLVLESGTVLDGLWVGTVTFPAEGPHEVTAVGVDAEGNGGLTSPTPANPIHAVVLSDATAPFVSIGGVEHGALVQPPVDAAVTATDTYLAWVDTRLNGTPWDPALPITADGDYRLSAEAADLAGNLGSDGVDFTVDGTPPAIMLGGVLQGSHVAWDVTPVVVVTDLHLGGHSVFLDGAEYVPITLTEERPYELEVLAWDLAGNVSQEWLRFTIDKTPPELWLAGVDDGAFVNVPVTITYGASDLNLLVVDGAMDGRRLRSGDVVAEEGMHHLRVAALDQAGNLTAAERRFTIDTQPPEIWTSVAEGGEYSDPVLLSFGATDPHLESVEATVDGVPVTSDTTFTTPGPHLLVITARDRAGNVAVREVPFGLSTQRFTVSKRVAPRHTRALALVACEEPAGGAAEAFLRGALSGAELTFVRSEVDLLVELRSGIHDVVVLTDALGPLGNPCPATRPVPPVPAGTLDHRVEQELTEAVFRGTGVLVLRSNQSAWPSLNEALGVLFEGNTGATLVDLGQTVFSAPMQLSVPDGVRLRLFGATAIGTFGGSDVSAAVHPFARGATVTLGFDPRTATPAEDARQFTAAAAGYLTALHRPQPRGVAAVQIQVTSEGSAADVVLRESVDPALGIVSAYGGGQLVSPGTIEWSFHAPVGETSLLEYLIRFPAEAGSYATTAEVLLAGPSGLTPVGTYPLVLVLPDGVSTLQSNAETLAEAIPARGTDAGNRRVILDRLAAVRANPGLTAEDRERAVTDLLAAIDAARALRGVDPVPIRLILADLLGFWEAQP
jgi:flagellar hook assembly protein FlgD/subtilase family serine protease